MVASAITVFTIGIIAQIYRASPIPSSSQRLLSDFVLRYGKRRGVNVRGKVELVVDDGEEAAVRLQSEIRRIVRGRQRDEMLESRGVDGMAESNRRHNLLQ